MSNPMLSRRLETTAMPPVVTTPGMTVGETVRNTFALLLAAVAAGAVAWMNADTWPVWVLWAGLLGGLGLVIVAMVKPRLAQYLAIPYALLEGVVLGYISRLYEDRFSGIVLQAVLATAVVFAVMLLLYVSRVIKVTQRLRSIVVGATLGILGFYVISLIGSMFGWSMPLVWDSGPWGILFSVVVAGIAAFNLLLDFDLIENGVRSNAPDWMNWFAAMGLMVTLVWLYLEILRLLAKIQSRD
ncbi:MAG TPA: Bax inhibitor-1/YccA family protein [Acidimicrobiia bacterium]|nr:Bax inhibitor-1/YccA family protein [Acidimicrobiia bacterium]